MAGCGVLVLAAPLRLLRECKTLGRVLIASTMLWWGHVRGLSGKNMWLGRKTVSQLYRNMRRHEFALSLGNPIPSTALVELHSQQVVDLGSLARQPGRPVVLNFGSCS